MKQGQRLKELLKAKKISPEQLGSRISRTKQAIYLMFEKEKLDDILLDKICQETGIDKVNFLDYSIPFEQSEFLEPPSPYNAKPANFENGRKNMIIVPLKAFGGFLTGYANRVYLNSLEHVPFPFVRGECFAFEVEGLSMIPDYPPGSYVVGTQVQDLNWMHKGKDYVFQTIDGIILKRFEKIADGRCYIKSLNDEYDGIKPLPLKSIKKVYYIEQKILKP